MSLKNELNDMQQKALESIDGPCLILAGAGSGKTRTITYKIAYMIKELNIEPSSILALTFTNKAANEMKERIANLIGQDIRETTVSTFHSFAVKIIRRFGNLIGFSSNFNIYDTDDSITLLRRILKEMDLKEDYKPRDLLNKISNLKEREILPKDLAKELDLDREENKIIKNIYENYQDALLNNNSVDFSDILLYLKILLQDKNVLNTLQDKYKYIFVDEYQDTNQIQFKIVSLLASRHRNICVVGDEDQSIYSFRGADIRNILEFELQYPDAKIIKLEQNYRSTPNILNLANSLIRHNSSSLGKKLWTSNHSGSKVKIFAASDAYEEASFICNVIKNSIGKEFKDFAILYRTNFQSRILEQELTRRAIPNKIFGGVSFYQRKEIKDILSYLILINNPYDFINFERAISTPRRGIGTKTIEKIREIASNQNINYIDAIKQINNQKTNSFAKLMDYLIDFSKNNKLSDTMQEIIKMTDYINFIRNEEAFEDRFDNIQELINTVLELEKNSVNITIDEYLTNITLSSSVDNLEDNTNVVKLMTIHSSKGLEFDTVFLAGFEENLFPSIQNIFDEQALEEERRLCYVAITRAEKELYLLYAKSRMIRGLTTHNNRPSKFLNDMDHTYLDNLNGNNIPKYTEKVRTSIQNFDIFETKTHLKVGQRVSHISYGIGKISKIDEKGITVDFLSGSKKIAVALANKFLKEV